MDQELKTSLMNSLAAGELSAVFAALTPLVGAGHPAAGRVSQLDKRYRELEGRMAQGTLSAADVERVKRRITGGLREIILDFNQQLAEEDAPETERESFTFSFAEDEVVVSEPEPAAPTGFQGEVNYVGSPSKQEASLVLLKGYGAAFHAAVQSIRKCGMEMVRADREGGTLEATATGNTVTRIGENIYLWVTPQERGRTLIKVIVDSANPKMVFDMGRNKQKLQAILHQLRNS